MDLTETFCLVDAFCVALGRTHFPRRRGPASRLYPSEVLTICVLFHRIQSRHFKFFYSQYVSVHLRREFPQLVSYSRFVQLSQQVNDILYLILKSSFGSSTNANFIDSTSLSVCHVNRANSHSTFKGMATWGKTSVGFFFGFKLHLVINEHGSILNFYLSSGNQPDQKIAEHLLLHAPEIKGKVYGDRGYISKKLETTLQSEGVFLITKKRKNMKAPPLDKKDSANLKRRFLIETVIGQLKLSYSYIEHHRHRSLKGFITNLLGGLLSYNLRNDKPSLNHSHPFPGNKIFRGKIIDVPHQTLA